MLAVCNSLGSSVGKEYSDPEKSKSDFEMCRFWRAWISMPARIVFVSFSGGPCGKGPVIMSWNALQTISVHDQQKNSIIAVCDFLKGCIEFF
jgi:hypothetical protein